MTKTRSTTVATIAIFFAIMVVIHLITSTVFNFFPLQIKPTIVHIPVIIASIVYGPRIGASLGGLMGVISVVHNTIVQTPASYLFSPFVDHGNLNSLIIALVPRILIGVTPYLVYKCFRNKFGLFLAGAVGSLTNTVFVLGGIFFLFASVYGGDIKAMLTAVVLTNASLEVILSVIFTAAIVPALEKLQK